jgi:obg-like ATPase 1
VPDARYEHLKSTWKPKSQIQAVLTVTDIAGLVKGAAEGKGLGNAFLSNIQAVDAIYHVTRGFLDAEVEHVEGSVDPARDFDIIKGELIAKDLAMMEGRVADLEKKVRQNAKDKNNRDNLETARKALTMLQEGKEVRFGDWKEKDIPYLNTQQLLTAKPVVYLINVSEKAYIEQKSKFFKEVKTWVDAHAPGDAIIPFSVVYEQKLMAMSEAERKAHIETTKAPSRIDRIITSGYKALGLIQFFTTGVDEVRSWTIRRGTKAPGAGGVIHTDFEKGFVCAEIYNYEDFKELGSEAAAKAAGRSRTQGKEYVMKDGDVVFFKANRK